MKKIAILAMAAMLLLAGCGGKNEEGQKDSEATKAPEANQTQTEGFVFESNGTEVALNAEAEPVINKLGKDYAYFEAASCAFNGKDKKYTYNDYEINTYPLDDVDYVNTIVLLSDLVSTKEGVSIGQSKDDMTKAYGTDFEEKGDAFTYTKGKSQLQFIIKDNAIESITYIAITK